MNQVFNVGRIFFAVALVVFGIQYLVHGQYAGWLTPMQDWIHGGPVFAYLTGAGLIAVGASIGFNKGVRIAAPLLAAFFLLVILFLHLPRVSEIWHDGGARTRTFEPLAMVAVALVLAGVSSRTSSAGHKDHSGILIESGRGLFAFAMVVFGVQHFMYADFIASLIPAWIPARLFLTYFTGIGFIAAAIAIVSRVCGRLGAVTLGIMFLSWVVLLHAPRVAMALHNGDEWCSLFVALSMSGGCFIIAQTLPPLRHSQVSAVASASGH